MPSPLRGAADHVLRYIQLQIAAGQHEITYLQMTIHTGYTIPSVLAAVSKLERENYIAVTRPGAGRSNSYQLVADDKRRAVAVARFVGLVL